jgi:hypothetical protein
VVLSSHVDLGTLAVSAGSLVNVLSGSVGSDEADSLDVVVSADLRHGVFATLDDVDHTIGDARLLEQVNEDLGGASDSLRGLEQVGVTESDGEGVHPERDHGWEVEGSDSSADTEGHSVGVNIDSASDALHGLAHTEGGEGASVLNNLVASENVALRVDEGLAVLLGDHGSDIVLVLLEELLVLEHVSHTLGDGDLLPRLEGVLVVLYGLVELSLSGQRNLGNHVLSKRTVDIESLGRLAVNPFSVDEVFVLESCN